MTRVTPGFDGDQMLAVLITVVGRRNESERRPMCDPERAAVETVGEQHVVMQQVLQR